MRSLQLFVSFLGIFFFVSTFNLHAQYHVLSVEEKRQKVTAHSNAFQALNERVRDPYILFGPDGYYYMTGTTAGSHWGDTIGIKIWRSPDLAEWESMGFVWDLYKDGKPDNTWHFSQEIRHPEYKNPIAIWAPEIHYINETYWVTYSLNVGGHSLLRSTSGKPEGPYEVLDPVQRRLIDSHLFEDDDGSVYYCWQADYIARMTDDMRAIDEEPFKIQHDGNHPMGYEGILIMKFGDVYVHIASGRYGYEPVNTYDLYYATSKNLYGPYGERRKLSTNAGHGNLFQDNNGNWWLTAFDHAFYDRTTMDRWSLWLVPVDVHVKQDDVVFHVKDKNFRPVVQDHEVVARLAETGIPDVWRGKQPWFRPVDEQAPETFTNPILPGGYPDPSIIRVYDTYYMVNSSFLWFPGVPVHRSKDLVNWEKIGHALHTPKHLDTSVRPGVHGGAWAPTIRYHDGLFYLTVTQRNSGASILTTATDPAGPWSEPIDLHSANGIDGSLLFDDDGRVWYCWSEDHKILLREFDKDQLQLIGETILLLDEQMYGDDYSHIEGPHIYKLDCGEYMLLIASGGTGSSNHNVSVFKSDSPKGPYTPNPNNPVLTHRGSDSPFTIIGHADIVQTQNGEWYAVMLGVRPLEGYSIMDRETFLVRFEWEDGWPVFNPEAGGLVLTTDNRPDLPWTPVPYMPERDDFNDYELGYQYNFYRTPHIQWWSLTDNPGHLRIYLQKPGLTDKANSPVVARRITQFDFHASTVVSFDPQKDETAGLVAMMNERGQMRLELFNYNGQKHVRLVTYVEGPQTPRQEIISESFPVDGDSVQLVLEARGLEYRFFAGKEGGALKQVGDVVHGSIISRQLPGSYSGAYVGVFASSNGQESDNYSDFVYFKYKTKKDND